MIFFNVILFKNINKVNGLFQPVLTNLYYFNQVCTYSHFTNKAQKAHEMRLTIFATVSWHKWFSVPSQYPLHSKINCFCKYPILCIILSHSLLIAILFLCHNKSKWKTDCFNYRVERGKILVKSNCNLYLPTIYSGSY